MFYYYFDPTYILVLIGIFLCLGASAWVNIVYRKYARVHSFCGLTGAQVAHVILQRNHVRNISVHHVYGTLSDHYDPGRGNVNLSDSVYDSDSVAAIAVAAHECGHVMQHEEGYAPLKIRTAMVPAVNFCSNIGIWMVLFGMILGLADIFVTLGIFLFSFGVFFQLVTLPVELNASSRGLLMLEQYGILGYAETKMAKAVLRAAALTYVASAAASILQLLRLLLLRESRRGRR